MSICDVSNVLTALALNMNYFSVSMIEAGAFSLFKFFQIATGLHNGLNRDGIENNPAKYG